MTGSSGTKYSAYRTILYEIKHTCTMHVYYYNVLYMYNNQGCVNASIYCQSREIYCQFLE